MNCEVCTSGPVREAKYGGCVGHMKLMTPPTTADLNELSPVTSPSCRGLVWKLNVGVERWWVGR